ncbi:uncharacterized protein LOC122091593 [Macadamia integrifolia]|uniref:uncharacterized protein LOC122091593 n=1 Tax=Macadamia integrifolia TaxID=60698 RepID=UPI001C4F0E4A|nr:uncharacterized protein LOC122091593 [Macadamia integrifolia]
MASLAQSSLVFSLNSSTGVSFSSSFKTNTYPSTFLKTGFSRSLRISASLDNTNSDSSPSNSANDSERIVGDEPETTDPVKLAFARAKSYKKAIQSNPSPKKDTSPVSESVGSGNRTEGTIAENVDGDTKKVPISVKQAMEKAKEYKKNKGIIGNAGSSSNVGETRSDSGLEGAKVRTLGDGFVDKRVSKKEEPVISSIDFMGLGFSDQKKSKGLPAGLVPLVDPFADGDLPEVELIVGDSSNFEAPTPSNPELKKEDDFDLYKPRVSTWGVFPRPGNISETFGGGRTIRPGEVLETAEDKAAKQARTRQLLTAYKNKMGLVIDPKLKSECEKALKDGDYLMDLGKLKEALPYYEKVMEDLTFQSELHGLAALQWSICQDSLSRPNEARVMYERLQSHPNVEVSKKAKLFMFGFQAMEMMKITGSSLSQKTTGFQNYFEAFIEDKPEYIQGGSKDEQNSLIEALPYILFLVSPIFLVLLVAVQRGT